MLVIMRRLGESIRIGDNVRVTALDTHGGDKVKLEFEAPKDVCIDRRRRKPQTADILTDGEDEDPPPDPESSQSGR